MDNNYEYKSKFIIFNIQKNYKFLSTYLTSLQNHLNNCYEMNILSLYDRNIRIGKIYELVKQLNSEYNNFIINKIDIYKNILDKYINFDIVNDNDNTFQKLRNYLKNLFNIDFNNDINNLLYPLDFKRRDIIDLSKDYGNINIYSILEILLKLNYNMLFNKDTNIFLKFINQVFIPLKFTVNNTPFVNKNNLYDNFNDSDYEDNFISYYENINIYVKENNCDELLKRIVCIEIKYNNQTILIEGIFNSDSINLYIKTCQISNKFLYYKKKNLESKLEKCRATRKFSKTFFRTLTVHEILAYHAKIL